ncbi:MAG: hypothetical protein J7M38_06070 [Armatimonadetes bacterium]|nr:hypothetical protein [Armatimonadota bacterium]
MIYENVELHNVAEITEGPDGGVLMQRVPESLRPHLNEAAQARILLPACGEIRFVTDDGRAKVTLSGVEGQVQISQFFGVFRNAGCFTVGPEPTTFEIEMPPVFTEMLPEVEKLDQPFSPHVCRLMMRGAQVCLHSVEGEGLRPPEADELPWLRYLAYGTSITHGGNASWPHLTYVAQTARRIGADLINLGLGGSCFAEPEMADYIAGRDDWHIATLALSVNMVGRFTVEEFDERVRYMINTVAGADTNRPVACITLYPYSNDLRDRSVEGAAKSIAFREVLRAAVRDCPHPNVHLLEGPEMLTDFGGLTTDLIHPADDGMIQMGLNIARRLQPLVNGIRR